MTSTHETLNILMRTPWQPDDVVDIPAMLPGWLFCLLLMVVCGVGNAIAVGFSGVGGNFLAVLLMFIPMLPCLGVIRLTHCRNRAFAAIGGAVLLGVMLITLWVSIVYLLNTYADHPAYWQGNELLERFYERRDYHFNMSFYVAGEDEHWYDNGKLHYDVAATWHRSGLLILQIGTWVEGLLLLVLGACGYRQEAGNIHDARFNQWAIQTKRYFPENAAKRIIELYEQGRLDELIHLPGKGRAKLFNPPPILEMLFEVAPRDDGQLPEVAYVSITLPGKSRAAVRRMLLFTHEIKALATIMPMWRVTESMLDDGKALPPQGTYENTVRDVPPSSAMQRDQVVILSQSLIPDGEISPILDMNHKLLAREHLFRWFMKLAMIFGSILFFSTSCVPVQIRQFLGTEFLFAMFVMVVSFYIYLLYKRLFGDTIRVQRIYTAFNQTIISRSDGAIVDDAEPVMFVEQLEPVDVGKMAIDFATLYLDGQQHQLIYEGLNQRYHIPASAIRLIEAGNILTPDFKPMVYPSVLIHVGDAQQQFKLRLCAYEQTTKWGLSVFRINVRRLAYLLEQWQDRCQLDALQQARATRYTEEHETT